MYALFKDWAMIMGGDTEWGYYLVLTIVAGVGFWLVVSTIKSIARKEMPKALKKFWERIKTREYWRDVLFTAMIFLLGALFLHYQWFREAIDAISRISYGEFVRIWLIICLVVAIIAYLPRILCRAKRF